MRRWVTQYVQAERTDAVGKAKDDVAEIAQTMDYEKLYVFLYDDSGEADEALNARIDGICSAVSPGDIILYQYPSKWFGHRFDSIFIQRMKARGAHFTLFIHDIDSFTGGAGTTIEEEVATLNLADVIISHSNQMSTWLTQQGVAKPMINKDIFDFLVDPLSARLTDNLQRRITVAGWLPKTPFLCDWQQNIPIDAYGAKDHMDLSEKVNYRGEFSQEDLITAIAKDTFGLSWADNVGGISHHEYQKLNNPLKVSLYLSLGMPVIVWSEAATAALIEKYKIGFTVNELSEIEEKLGTLSDEELHDMKVKANQFSRLTRNGYFTRKAILEAEDTVFLNEL